MNNSLLQVAGNPLGAGKFLCLSFFSLELIKDAGFIRIQIVNMRLPIQFKYFKAQTDGSFAELASTPIINVDLLEPMQGHLAVTGDPTEAF